MLLAGERYLARYPDGPHAEEVHAELEHGYALRGQWAAALEHAEKRREPDAADIADYRAKVAEQLLAAAEKQQRVDLRLGLPRDGAARVRRHAVRRRGAHQVRRREGAASPQRIRLTREFLLEHPALWAPGALALKPELLDGKRANGEMAEEGVTLLGKNAIEIALVGRDPVVARVPAADFARFVAQLEETRYASLATDERETADPRRGARRLLRGRRGWAWPSAPSRARPRAPRRCSRARTRSTASCARARASCPSTSCCAATSTTLGLAAFPRIRMPEATPDALLYE